MVMLQYDHIPISGDFTAIVKYVFAKNNFDIFCAFFLIIPWTLSIFESFHLFICNRDIHDNLLQCNCGILELKEFLFMREIGTNVLCRGPKEHANHALLAIPDFSLCSKQGNYEN